MNTAWITDAVRTPIVRAHGQFADVELEDLVAPLLNALLARNGLAATDIDEVVLGNAAGPGGNPARLSLLQAGFPDSVPGLTVDRQCGSGLEAINLGARLVQSGAARCVIAGGAESVSKAPVRGTRGDDGEIQLWHRARFSPDAIGDPDMGIAAENVAEQFSVSRVEQDRFALQSHQKACAAQAAGVFDQEIVAISTQSSTGIEPRSVRSDDCPRDDTSLEALAALAPVFKSDGTVTAGNACPVNDGAAMVLIQAAGTTGSALRFVDSAASGVDPNVLGTGPVPAVQQLLERTGLQLDSIQRIEFNEAFAAQVLACTSALGLDRTRLNPDGGAIALGHPYGASGAILVTRLLHSYRRQTPGLPFRGLATLGIGGGLGLATLLDA